MLNNIPFFSLSEAINKFSYLSYEKKMIGNNGILFAKRTRPDEIKLLSEKIENLIKFSKKIDVEPDPKTVDEINKAIDDCERIISRKSGQKIPKIANLQYYKSKANYGTKKKGISR